MFNMNLSVIALGQSFIRHKNLLTIPFSFKLSSRTFFFRFPKKGGSIVNFQLLRKYCTVHLARPNPQLKKQPFKKKSLVQDTESLKIVAFSAAQEFDLETLSTALKNVSGYTLSSFNAELTDSSDVIHIVVEREEINPKDTKDVFIFREGSVVLWNFREPEITNFMEFLNKFHKGSFSGDIVQSDSEYLSYVRSESAKTNLKNEKLILSISGNEVCEKFAVSNAMALSVHLGAYENLLNDYIDSMLPVTEDLKSGRKIKMSQREVLMKMGQLFSLRHVINLSSDLLDTPDFYWEREDLEKLYRRTFNYFSIGRRTQVVNEKINHCIELVQLLSTQLSDAHHIRLEWMIIVLILVEVCFEVFHYTVNYMNVSS